VDREVRVTCLRGRTSDRTDGAGRGAEALARLLGGRVLGDAAPGRPRDWSEDLPDARPVLEAAAAELSAALDQAELPVLTASDCSICIATLPTVAARVPGVRVLWIDAHGDFNSPQTTPSGFLGGMCLAAACGVWESGLGSGLDPARVVMCGVRDVDPGERVLLDTRGVGLVENPSQLADVLDAQPVFVHLDLDVLDPEHFPAAVPAPNGLHPDKLYDLADSVLDESELLGLEITNFAVPDDDEESAVATETALHVLEPFLDHLTERA
jgi:arginase family enzyme